MNKFRGEADKTGRGANRTIPSKAGTRRKRLLKRGADPAEVHLATRSRKGNWRLSAHRIVPQAPDLPSLQSLGLPSLRELWIAFRYGPQASA